MRARRGVAAILAGVAVSLSCAGTAGAASGATHLVWKPVYLAHVTSGRILSVTSPATTSVWALGRTFPAQGTGYSFLLHWNGHRWSRPALPARGINGVFLASSSASNVWLFGWTRTGGGVYTAWRWNGSQWLRINLPAVDQFGVAGAAVLSSTDVWTASGATAARWTGHGWQLTSLPASHSYETIAGSGTDLWVAALVPAAGSSPTGTLIVYRRLGGTWQTVRLPRIGPIKLAFPPQLAVPSAGHAWVTAVTTTTAALLHWYAGSWHQKSDPAPTSQFLAGYGRTGVWADWSTVWTGSRWMSLPFTGPALLPTALAAVPRSSAAWLAGNAGGGQEVLRAVWQ